MANFRHPLDPRFRDWADQCRQWLYARRWYRPGWFRRVLAAALAALAAALAWWPTAAESEPMSTVVTTARDLAPGTVLSGQDLVLRRVPTALAAAGVLTALPSAEGQTLAGPARSGEQLTDFRVINQSLERVADVRNGRSGSAVVPVRLAENAIADLLYPGRKIDIIGRNPRQEAESVLASEATVLSVRKTKDVRQDGFLAIVSVPRENAAAVAAASVHHAVTVTLR